MNKNRYYALWLCLTCIIVFVLQFIPGFTDLFVLDQSRGIEVWRFVTSIFLHGGLLHLLYNMFALALFGTILENFIGSKKFLTVFFVSGIMANIISIFFYNSALGASGAIFGVIGALVIIRPGMTVWAYSLPMPMFLAGILWAVGDLIGAAAFLSGNPMDNTGNIAHLSGMLFGIIFGVFFREWRKPKQIVMELDENHIRQWENGWN